MLFKTLAGALLALSAPTAPAWANGAPPARPSQADDMVLTGTLTRADLGSYRELPFSVPAGVGKLTIDVEWEGRENGTILVTGLYDPQRQRGWGGGIKPHIVVAPSFASTSYLPGPLPEGTWRLSLAVASIRPGKTSAYKIHIHFSHGPEAQVVTPIPVNGTPGWYRGDLHTHTGESDAACRSQRGLATPCPVYFTLKAAADRGLDFVSITDHNVSSHVALLAEMAPYFDQMLIIPGREVTTQFGHFNLIGIAEEGEFRVGPVGAPDINALFQTYRPTGALVSVNHPEIATGEDCLGCGWSAPNTDWKRVDMVEVSNGGVAAEHGGFNAGPASGTAFWEKLLQAGRHITGIGGSDNHDPIDGKTGTSPVGAQSPIGTSTTVVYAAALSQPAIEMGLRSGRAFVDVDGSHHGAIFDLQARSGERYAVMGGTLERKEQQPIKIVVHVEGMPDTRVGLVVDGKALPPAARQTISGSSSNATFEIARSVTARWARADLFDAHGARLLIGNPVYISAVGSDRR